MSSLCADELFNWNKWVNYRFWRSPWLLGVAHAFNFGIALAANPWVFMLGADDILLPTCLEECEKAIQTEMDYLWVGVQYSDGRPDQFLPCNAAMVNKALWRATGGFPPKTAVGAPDAAFVSMAMAAKGFPAKMRCVNEKVPLYWYRVHPDTDTATRAPRYQGAILEVRNVLTQTWQPPEWGRYE